MGKYPHPTVSTRYDMRKHNGSTAERWNHPNVNDTFREEDFHKLSYYHAAAPYRQSRNLDTSNGKRKLKSQTLNHSRIVDSDEELI